MKFIQGQVREQIQFFCPADLLKLFLYGYLNRIRSSRQLEKECSRNMEVMRLMKRLASDHNTISNFRRDNPSAIRKVFQVTVKMARHFGLIGGKLLAGDGTRLRAQNSKKNNFNEKKIEKHLVCIDQKLMEYNAILQDRDGDKTPQGQHTCIQKKTDRHQAQRRKYESPGQYLSGLNR